jgi:uncharacterized membrane protein YfcA
MKFWIVGIGIGVSAGVLAGLIGLGGGVLIVPALVYFLGMNQKMAQGTSLAVLLPPSGAMAFWQYYKTGNVDVKMAALIFCGLLLGGWFGGGWAQQFSNDNLRKGFAIFLVLTAANMWFKK